MPSTSAGSLRTAPSLAGLSPAVTVLVLANAPLATFRILLRLRRQIYLRIYLFLFPLSHSCLESQARAVQTWP